MVEVRTRIFDLYRELFDRSGRAPNLEDIARVVEILRLMQRAGQFDREAVKGVIGHSAEALGITPGMLWISLVLCGMLVGKPFFDFLKQILPFLG